MSPKTQSAQAGDQSLRGKKLPKATIYNQAELKAEGTVLIDDILGTGPKQACAVCESCVECERNCREALEEEPKNLLEYAYHRASFIEHYSDHGWRFSEADVDRYHGVLVGSKNKSGNA